MHDIVTVSSGVEVGKLYIGSGPFFFGWEWQFGWEDILIAFSAIFVCTMQPNHHNSIFIFFSQGTYYTYTLHSTKCSATIQLDIWPACLVALFAGAYVREEESRCLLQGGSDRG